MRWRAPISISHFRQNATATKPQPWSVWSQRVASRPSGCGLQFAGVLPDVVADRRARADVLSRERLARAPNLQGPFSLKPYDLSQSSFARSWLGRHTSERFSSWAISEGAGFPGSSTPGSAALRRINVGKALSSDRFSRMIAPGAGDERQLALRRQQSNGARTPPGCVGAWGLPSRSAGAALTRLSEERKGEARGHLARSRNPRLAFRAGFERRRNFPLKTGHCASGAETHASKVGREAWPSPRPPQRGLCSFLHKNRMRLRLSNPELVTELVGVLGVTCGHGHSMRG